MTAQEIAAKIDGLQERIECLIYSPRAYNKKWRCVIEFKDEGQGIELEATGLGSTLEESMEDAWYKIEKVTTRGLGKSAMMPALEAPKPAKTNLDDEIPF